MSQVDLMMWMQTIMIGVNTIVLLLMTGTTIRWVMKVEEKDRSRF